MGSRIDLKVYVGTRPLSVDVDFDFPQVMCVLWVRFLSRFEGQVFTRFFKENNTIHLELSVDQDTGWFLVTGIL